MNQSAYNFKRCKLCGQFSATPAYPIHNACLYSCQNCDFHYLDVLDEDISSIPSTQLTDTSRRYIESRLEESHHLHHQRLKLIQKHINISKAISLDIGAGLGQFQLLVAADGGESFGIEPSHLRRQYAAETFSVDLSEKLVENPFWQENFSHHFDLITLWDVIEHVNFPRVTLQAAVKLLKSGGTIGLETPSRDIVAYRASLFTHRFSKGRCSLFLPTFYSTTRYGHKQIFTQNQLLSLLRQVGLQIIELRHSYANSLALKHKLIIVARKP